VVRAGPASALLDGAFLRRVRVGGREVLRGVYAAVRDQSWGTVEPTFSRYDLQAGEDAFRLRFTAEHRRGEIDFVWDGEYVGEPSGRIVFRLDGLCRTTFRKNRIGFCLLHPPELAGTPYVRETPAGPIEERFPELISPRRDVSEMRALRYECGPVGVELRFAGDLFDMEDQRNWTDASYKTFCTPLSRPYPVQVQAGQRIAQTVTLELRVPAGLDRPAPHGGPDAIVSDRSVGRLPPIGLACSSDGRPLGARAIERLRELRPAHLRVELDPRAAVWRDVLGAATADAVALGTPLDVAIVTDEAGAGVEQIASALAPSPVPVLRFATFADEAGVTTRPLLARARAAGPPGRIGGGSRSHFAQVNMQAAAVPLSELEFVAYGVDPQAHAFDDLSVMETLSVQGATVESARALAGERPIVVGPITLRAGEADPRQTTSFAAAWTVGSLHRLGAAGASGLTYFETVGPSGVLDTSGAPYPAYDVLAAAAPWSGADVLEVALSDPFATEALALRSDHSQLVLVANLTAEQRRVVVALPSGGSRAVDLGPYAVIRIDPG
jgi:hypothetical protein